jgi:glutaredoxin
MSYNIKIIALENCDYSNKSLKLLQDNNIKYELVEVDHINKDKFKTNIISTFPQIYLTKQNNMGHLLLGGYNELNYTIKLFKNIDNKNTFYKNKEQFMSENINWSNKATLRLIELINNNQNNII